MKRAIRAVTAVLGSCLLGSSLAQTAPTPAVTNTSTSEFMTQAARVAMLDLAAASEVEQRIKDPAYRAYARQVIADDTKMQGTLETLARGAGQSLPNGLDDQRALALKDLQSSDGAQLEQKYRSSQIGGTRQAIELFQNFERNQRDPRMKLWLETALPTLEKRLEAASRLPQVPSAPQG